MCFFSQMFCFVEGFKTLAVIFDKVSEETVEMIVSLTEMVLGKLDTNMKNKIKFLYYTTHKNQLQMD